MKTSALQGAGQNENIGASPDGKNSQAPVLPITSIGFIGLGNMGLRIAGRLQQCGQQVLAHDISVTASEAFAQTGGALADSALAVADRTEIVFCSLPTPDVVEHVLLGERGVVHGGAVKIVVDLSTTGPQRSVALAARLAEQRIAFIEAPVSGGMTGAAEGTLTIMASGPRTTYDVVEPLLQHCGKKIYYLGEKPGLGQALKLANNMLVAVNTVSAFEALAFGVKAGLDPKTMIDVINVSSGRTGITLDKAPKWIVPGDYPLRFATDLLYKDVRLGVEEAEKLGVPLWMIPVARQFLSFAIMQGDGQRDYLQTIRHYEKWANVQVGEKPAEPAAALEDPQ